VEAMTVKAVIRELRMQGIVLSLQNTCLHINNVVSQLASIYDTALTPVEININALAGDNNDLATLGVLSVKHNGRPYLDYKANAYTITFNDDGDYTVTALMYPDNVASENDNIPVHIAYHPAIVQYVKHKAQPLTLDGKPTENEFYAMAQAVHLRLSRVKSRGLRAKARIWR
jgi:hypothetical protein